MLIPTLAELKERHIYLGLDLATNTPLAQAVGAVLRNHSYQYPAWLCRVDCVAGFIGTTISTPAYLLKDLILVAFASLSSIIAEKRGLKEFAKKKCFGSLVSGGVAVASPIGTLYPFSPFPKKLSLLADPQNMINQFNSVLNKIPPQIQRDHVLGWLKTNGDLAQTIVEKVPEFKSFAPLIPALVPLAKESLAWDVNTLCAFAKQAEKINTPSVISTATAAMKVKLSDKIHKFARIDARMTFAMTILMAPIHLITQCFVIAIARMSSLVSNNEKLKAFLVDQQFKLQLTKACILLSLKGIVNPEAASAELWKLLQPNLPQELTGFAEEVNKHWNPSWIPQALSWVTPEGKERLIQLRQNLSQQLLELIPILAEKDKDFYKKIVELAQYTGVVLPFSNKEAADIAPVAMAVATIAQKHETPIKNLAALIKTTDDHQVRNISQWVETNPQVIEDALKAIVENPQLPAAAKALGNSFPAGLLTPPFLEQLPQVTREASLIVKENAEDVNQIIHQYAPKLIVSFSEKQEINPEAITKEIIKQYPKLAQNVIAFREKNPKLESQIIEILNDPTKRTALLLHGKAFFKSV